MSKSVLVMLISWREYMLGFSWSRGAQGRMTEAVTPRWCYIVLCVLSAIRFRSREGTQTVQAEAHGRIAAAYGVVLERDGHWGPLEQYIELAHLSPQKCREGGNVVGSHTRGRCKRPQTRLGRQRPPRQSATTAIWPLGVPHHSRVARKLTCKYCLSF